MMKLIIYLFIHYFTWSGDNTGVTV